MSNLNSYEPLWGEWKAKSLLGQGSYGIVYQAESIISPNKKDVAIKHISIPKDQGEINGICIQLGTRDEEAVKGHLIGMRDQIISEYLQMKEFRNEKNFGSCEDVTFFEKKIV